MDIYRDDGERGDENRGRHRNTRGQTGKNVPNMKKTNEEKNRDTYPGKKGQILTGPVKDRYRKRKRQMHRNGMTDRDKYSIKREHRYRYKDIHRHTGSRTEIYSCWHKLTPTLQRQIKKRQMQI